MEKRYWLVTTAHLKDRLWFKDEDDYKTGMNYVAALAATQPVRVMAFTLMSNHVHFVLEGDKASAKEFTDTFKGKYSQYYSKKYRSHELLKDNDVDIREVKLEDESFHRAVAYVHMNSVAANICLHPTGYLWGTGACFFYQSSSKGPFLKSMSKRAVIRLTHSKVTFPDTYYLHEAGFIHPSSYVPVRFVEKVFRTAKSMEYFLKASSKAKRTQEAPSFSDTILSKAITELCVSLFRRYTLAELNPEEKTQLFKQLRYRFSADPNQLSRISGVPYEEVAKMLDSI